MAGIQESADIQQDQDEVTFTAFIPAGRYDLEARLIDKENKMHPAYYLYIEKL